MFSSKQLGRIGEDTASRFLENSEYLILAQNFKSKFGEIDVIAKSKSGIICFIEVKHYNKNSPINPLQVITAKKQHRILTTARLYISKHYLDEFQYRFDLIIVENSIVSKHLKNIFEID